MGRYVCRETATIFPYNMDRKVYTSTPQHRQVRDGASAYARQYSCFSSIQTSRKPQPKRQSNHLWWTTVRETPAIFCVTHRVAYDNKNVLKIAIKDHEKNSLANQQHITFKKAATIKKHNHRKRYHLREFASRTQPPEILLPPYQPADHNDPTWHEKQKTSLSQNFLRGPL